MGKYNAIKYESLVNDPNSFQRPRQKMWGVYIISGYTESQGDRVPLNFDSDDVTNHRYFGIERIGIDGKFTSHYNGTYYKGLLGYNEAYEKPEGMKGPEGEPVLTRKGTFLKKDAKALRTERRYYNGYYEYYDIYDENDIYHDIDLYFYYKIIKTISWDLIMVTPNQHEAKELVNDWLRKPEISRDRPKIGIDSVIMAEIIPSDSIIEL